MKLVTYQNGEVQQLALAIDSYLYNMDELDPALPATMTKFLTGWDKYIKVAQEYESKILKGSIKELRKIDGNTVQLLAPVPAPTSCRDAYAFHQHVAAARRNRQLPMIPQFYEYPVFYFTNHRSIQGPGPVACMPDHLEKLDFELEIAIVICKEGMNIKAEDAEEYIGGLMIMNDVSARRLQMEEMLLNLGPAKGKDFATAIGPVLVTLNELKAYEIAAPRGHVGNNWNLDISCKVNGVRVSSGNAGSMDWTFAEIIERASYGTSLYAGDIIGSGTVGTGCFLELNGTGKLNDPAYREQWLQHGDEIEMEVEGLGILKNTIALQVSDWSILQRKKSSDPN